jgi:hypothetical protein
VSHNHRVPIASGDSSLRSAAPWRVLPLPFLLLSMAALWLPDPARGEGREAATRNRDANQAFEQQQFEQSTELYDEALTLEPESGIISYNLGNSLYRQGQFDEAATALMRGALSDDPQVRQSALYNLGNTFVQMQKYPEALTAYRKALELDPNDLDTKINFEKALQLLQQQQQQQQQQQEQKPGDDKQEGDNQQDQQNQNQDQQQQQDQDQQGDQQQEQNDEQEQQQNQDQSQGDQDQEQQEQQDEQQQQEAQADSLRAVGEMTPEEALRILDAMREQEKELQKEKMRKAQARVRGVEKDW